jgi:hypothetical protein
MTEKLDLKKLKSRHGGKDITLDDVIFWLIGIPDEIANYLDNVEDEEIIIQYGMKIKFARIAFECVEALGK